MIECKMPRELADEQRLREFLHRCVAGRSLEQAQLLRQAALMFDLPTVRLDILEAMLAVRAYESAALLLIGERPFLASRGESGLCLASAVLGDGDSEVTVEAATPALAILAAHVSALLSERQGAAKAPGALPRTLARLH